MSDFRQTLLQRAELQERSVLRSIAQEALAQEPNATALSDLARSAQALGALESDDQARALEHVRWGMASNDKAQRWDGVHLAGELLLPDHVDELVPSLLAVIDDAKETGTLRARAIEAYAEIAPAGDVEARLDTLRTDDPSWTVRRAAKDATRRRKMEGTTRGSLFSRFEAMVRTERVRVELDEEELTPKSLASLGLRLPAAMLSFYLEHFAGGRMVFLEQVVKGDAPDAGSLTLTSPPKLVKESGRRPTDLVNFNEYVYTRYVDGGSSYPKVDEDYALRRYAEFYDRGWVDDEGYNYGVLLFESAFRLEDQREALLLRCQSVLQAFCDMTGEEWEEIDDRLLEADDAVREEGLAWPAQTKPLQPVVLGLFHGVIELVIDLESPGLYARDTDDGTWWLAARCVSLFLNGPTVERAGEAERNDPLTLLKSVEASIEAGEKRKAARYFADALERDRKGAAVLKAVGAILSRADLDPLGAAQLCSAILLEGDRTSTESVKAALQAVSPERALAMVEAIVPYDEDGSQAALFINAAAGLRKKTHAEVKAAAKLARDGRGKAHIRTLRNPWHK